MVDLGLNNGALRTFRVAGVCVVWFDDFNCLLFKSCAVVKTQYGSKCGRSEALLVLELKVPSFGLFVRDQFFNFLVNRVVLK